MTLDDVRALFPRPLLYPADEQLLKLALEAANQQPTVERVAGVFRAMAADLRGMAAKLDGKETTDDSPLSAAERPQYDVNFTVVIKGNDGLRNASLRMLLPFLPFPGFSLGKLDQVRQVRFRPWSGDGVVPVEADFNTWERPDKSCAQMEDELFKTTGWRWNCSAPE